MRAIRYLIFSILAACTASQAPHASRAITKEEALTIALSDYIETYRTPERHLESREGKPFNVFKVYVVDSIQDLWRINISPVIDDHISQRPADKLGERARLFFPTNYRAEQGKLFLWNDGSTLLDREVLEVMHDFEILDSTVIKREAGTLPVGFVDERVTIIDDQLRSRYYYICKRGAGNYASIDINDPRKRRKPRRLKCDEH